MTRRNGHSQAAGSHRAQGEPEDADPAAHGQQKVRLPAIWAQPSFLFDSRPHGPRGQTGPATHQGPRGRPTLRGRLIPLSSPGDMSPSSSWRSLTLILEFKDMAEAWSVPPTKTCLPGVTSPLPAPTPI